MDANEIKVALENIQYLAMDININEIDSHIHDGNILKWIRAWRGAMDEQINNIKEALK